jgi:hypothetical protein
MSLLDVVTEKFRMIDKTTVDDGMGGYERRWVDGAAFDAAMSLDDSVQAQTAMAAGVTGVYTVTTKRAINLQFHDVFKRLSDGKIFRVTTDGDDKKTPTTAGLDMRSVRAEEWTLPDD